MKEPDDDQPEKDRQDGADNPNYDVWTHTRIADHRSDSLVSHQISHTSSEQPPIPTTPPELEKKPTYSSLAYSHNDDDEILPFLNKSTSEDENVQRHSTQHPYVTDQEIIQTVHDQDNNPEQIPYHVLLAHQQAELLNNVDRIRYIAERIAGRQENPDDDQKEHLLGVKEYFHQNIPDFVWRYVPFGRVMGFFGTLSTNGLPGDDLGKQVNMDTGEGLGFSNGSKILKKGSEYHAFISYRWQTGRFRTWLAMCYHFNFYPAVSIPLILGIIVWFCLSLITNPCDHKFPNTWYCFPYSRLFTTSTNTPSYVNGIPNEGDVSKTNTTTAMQGGEDWMLGAWWFGNYIWFGLTVFLLFFGMPLLLWGKRCFVDRFCINQRGDPQYNAMGLMTLNQTLGRSQRFVALFDEHYFQRLWFEVACYYKSRDKPKISFVNVWSGLILVKLPLMLIVMIVSIFAWNGMTNEQRMCAHHHIGGKQNSICRKMYEDADNESTHDPSAIRTAMLIYTIIFAIFLWWWGRKYVRARDELIYQSERFDVRYAQCMTEDDRTMLLTTIELMWGGDDSPTGVHGIIDVEEEQVDLIEATPGIKRFNEYVRSVLRLNVSSNKLDLFRLIPYPIAIDWYAFYWALNVYSLNFYPFWDERNVMHHEDLRETPQYYLFGNFSPWRFFILEPIMWYLLGMMIYLFVRVDQKYPMKKAWFSFGVFVWGLAVLVIMYIICCAVFFWLRACHDPSMRYRNKSDLNVHTQMKYPLPMAMEIHIEYDTATMTLVMVLDWILIVCSFLLVWWMYEPEWSKSLRMRSKWRWLHF